MQFHSELPLVESVDVADPLAAARALVNLPHPFLLHSAATDARARWSFFGADPFAVFRGPDYDGACALWRRLAREARANDELPTLVPFTGGVVGYWAYDFGRRLETLPAIAADDLGLPDVVLGFYDVVGAYDHETRQAWLFSSGLPLEGAPRAARARDRLRQVLQILSAGRRTTVRLPVRRDEVSHPRSTFTPDGYRAAVDRVRAEIARGQIFQANLSQRWTIETDTEPTPFALAIADALALFSPAPYGAFLGCGDHAVASASPERFLELRGRRVETRPIKGTRPRGADADTDAALRAALLGSEKDRAENVMIVDVLRNDLGRVCEAGSVEVSGLCELEVFPQVFHLTSTVTGTLAAGRDAFDLLHACFPGGSITGAPKIRAMELLEAIEPVRRHLYTGSIGYLDWRGDADWNIAIRTAIVTPTALHFAAGGGITSDSDPDAELRETLDKAEGMRIALERVVGPVEIDAAAARLGAGGA
ncbi:MAG: anthranilate synthase component I family protein [Candidatus Eisenbacteria bacterium]|uniref:Anthranilate synthase component I family protein n=1 Tax=Eiseniibacteriota bacterium TaxID=2212470 RepID=A0A9D6QK38_UNCEI|nr:anthranilate synthase component I family protein [Candidatus Eisenbacteria bacterium]MBI3539900.1 anthranilate synthase component I family protein [Candidatus Eisenbacteria bacterium]